MLSPGHVGYRGLGARVIEGTEYPALYTNPMAVRYPTRHSRDCNEEELNSYIVADTLVVLEHTYALPVFCCGSFTHKATRAKMVKPDAFIEVHCNAYTDEDVRGYEIWTDGDAKSVALAQEIAKRMMSYTPIPPRTPILKDMESEDNTGSWKDQHDALFEHLPEAERDYPLVLLEVGFLSNPQDAEWLTNLAHHQKIAAAITHGLESFFSD
jgi:hypothetical protein